MFLKQFGISINYFSMFYERAAGQTKTYGRKYLELIFILAILTVAFLFSSYKLTEAPTVWYDEGFYSQAAENLALHGVWGVQVGPGEFVSLSALSAGYPLIVPVAFSYKIFGASVLSGRAVMVFFIIAFLVASYFFVRRLFGVSTAILSTLLLVTFPVLYGNGKSILGEVPAFLFMLLALIFFERVLNSKRTPEIILTGFLLGVTMASKVTFLLGGLPAFLLALFFYQGRITYSIRTAILFLTGFLISMLVWVLTQFGPEDTISSVIGFYTNPYSTDMTHSGLLANATKFFTETSPAYLFVLTTAWVTSLGIRLFHREKISFSEATMFLFTMFIYLVFLKSPGWYRYFFPAQLAVLLFTPHAFFTIARELWSRFTFLSKMSLRAVILGIIVLLSSIQAYQTLFSSFVADYYGSSKTSEMENYFSNTPHDRSYFVYNVPEIVVFLPSTNYYQYIRPHENQLIGKEEIIRISQGVPERVIVYGGAYKGHETDFLPYAPEEIVSKYVILTRATSTEDYK